MEIPYEYELSFLSTALNDMTEIVSSYVMLGFRMVIVEKYLMIYKVLEVEKKIVFYRVLDGKRDYPTLMNRLYNDEL